MADRLYLSHIKCQYTKWYNNECIEFVWPNIIFQNTNMSTSTIACRHNHIHISKDEHLQTYGMNGVTMAAQDANTVTKWQQWEINA